MKRKATKRNRKPVKTDLRLPDLEQASADTPHDGRVRGLVLFRTSPRVEPDRRPAVPYSSGISRFATEDSQPAPGSGPRLAYEAADCSLLSPEAAAGVRRVTAGITKLASQDLRRTCARLCHARGGEVEQIQFLLRHVSIQTTERNLGCKQRIRSAVTDRVGLESSAVASRRTDRGRPGSHCRQRHCPICNQRAL